MKIFAISDLHLAFQVDKPMDVFGMHWDNYEQKILEDWNQKVTDNDVGIIAGDISWAMRMDETVSDFEYLSKLRGKKIVVRGNHDYWWSTISKVRDSLPSGVTALQNDSVRFGDIVFCGTRGWKVPERRQILKKEDKTIHDREVIRFELSLQDAVKKLGGKESGESTEKKQKLVAILHFPPFNFHCDDSAFTALCEKYGVHTCIYGHLHGQNFRGPVFTQKNGVNYYLTSCDIVGHKVVEINI